MLRRVQSTTNLTNAWDILPAAGLAVVVTAALLGMQLLPLGTGAWLIRLPDQDPCAALIAAARADAALINTPAPGFAVLYGDASRVRTALGLAIAWQGTASCVPIQ